MMKFEQPDFEIIRFEYEDIMVGASDPNMDEVTGIPGTTTPYSEGGFAR